MSNFKNLATFLSTELDQLFFLTPDIKDKSRYIDWPCFLANKAEKTTQHAAAFRALQETHLRYGHNR